MKLVLEAHGYTERVLTFEPEPGGFVRVIIKDKHESDELGVVVVVCDEELQVVLAALKSKGGAR